MTEQKVFLKHCRSTMQAAKERALLQMLAQTPVGRVTPRATDIRVDAHKLVMTYIEGTMPRVEDIGADMLTQIGRILRELRSIPVGMTYGAFNADLEVERPFVSFTAFLEAQVMRWVNWLYEQPNALAGSYATWLQSELVKFHNYFDNVQPCFCHGDVDFKNVIMQGKEIVGLVDWEHAGVYCLEWELRKLPRVLTQIRQWQILLTACGVAKVEGQHALLRAVRALEAADLLGHLCWCRHRDLHVEYQKTIRRMQSIMHSKEVM